MAKTSTPQRIAVLGCGNIGSTFAFQLARAGNDVTVIARAGSTRLDQLLRDGGIVDVKGERADVHVADTLDPAVEYDLLIVTIMAHKLTGGMPSIQGSSAKCIQFMINTFEPHALQEMVGAERCAFGMPFVQAKLDAEGRLKASIGAGGQKTLMNEQRWVDVFNEAGLPAAKEPDMPLWLRCHAPMCVAFESVSVAAMRRGSGASWREAFVLARGVHASFRLIKALGDPIYPKSKKVIARSPTFVVAAMLRSMSRIQSFRELLSTGKEECVALIETMVAAARRAGDPVPVRLIKAMKPS